jgi:alcohol dehydrogenase
MLGAAHAAANPLTARLDIVHGHAVGMMLPHVVRYNAAQLQARQAYAELAAMAGLASPAASAEEAVEALARRVEALVDAAGLTRSLVEAGASPGLLQELAGDAAEQWTGTFNPRPFGALEICRAAFRSG